MTDRSGLDAALTPLIEALEAMISVQRYLHPSMIGQLKEKLRSRQEPLVVSRERLASFDWPEGADAVRSEVDTSCELALKAISGFCDVPSDPEGIFMAYRALRYAPYAMETLYPAAGLSMAVSQFYLEPDSRDDTLHKRIEAAGGHEDTGVLHFNNSREEKGGCSIYVPEYYDPDVSYPVVFALHGGSGHGRAFLWTWLREARTRGFILVSPTARIDTWSIMQPEVDTENIDSILEAVRERWNVDASRMLMTGMSDGGTFTYMSGLASSSPFTHLAPIAASFHLMMLQVIGPTNILGRPIYLTHGLQDWMFDVEVARVAKQVLEEQGAELVYREITDLSHTYPRDENPRILEWFLGGIDS